MILFRFQIITASCERSLKEICDVQLLNSPSSVVPFFTRTGNTTLLSVVAGTEIRMLHVWPGGRCCSKIAGTMWQNIHRTGLFAICCRYWGHLATDTATLDFCRGTALKIAGVAMALGFVCSDLLDRLFCVIV